MLGREFCEGGRYRKGRRGYGGKERVDEWGWVVKKGVGRRDVGKIGVGRIFSVKGLMGLRSLQIDLPCQCQYLQKGMLS